VELDLSVNGVSGTVRLWPAIAPNTVDALIKSLPLETQLRQCRWSGDACFTSFDNGPISEIENLEHPVVTIYPGTIAVRLAEDISPHAELLVGYGSAEHRWPDGPKPVTPVGEISEGIEALLDQMRDIAANGPVPMTLRVAAEGEVS